VAVPEGHSFACEGEAAEVGVLETRSHADGQYLDKRTFLQVGRGQPVGLYAPLRMAGPLRDTSINRATAVGRELRNRCPLLLSVLTLSAFTDAFRPCPHDLHCLASLKSGARWGLAISRRSSRRFKLLSTMWLPRRLMRPERCMLTKFLRRTPRQT
jgi:hypothetical protein